MTRVSVHKAKPASSATGSTPSWFAATQRFGLIQRRSDGQSSSVTVPPIVHEVLRSPGQPLDAATRAYMEPRFGHDFSKVRVHADTRAAAAASSVDARAFTSNQRIVFGIGEYAPQAQSGRLLLAHELAHVVQQRTGVQLKDGVGQAGDPYERHADSIANLVVQGRTAKLPFAGLASRAPTAEVAVLQKQNLPSPDITKVVTGKAVPTRKEIDDSNKENYFDIVDQGPDHYMAAIKYLIQVYKINSSHALMRYDPTTCLERSTIVHSELRCGVGLARLS